MLVYLRTTSPHRRTISPNRDDWALTLGLEAPDITIDKTGDPDADKRARAPDGGFNVRWTPGDRGHVQFSSIFRSIGIDGEAGSNDDVLGWGVESRKFKLRFRSRPITRSMAIRPE
jgi:hypothetical protein